MIFVIGGRSRLGRAIVAGYPAERVTVPERSVYEGWSQGDCADRVARYLAGKGDESSTVLVTAGLLDPSLPDEDLWRVNFELPKNILAGAARLGMRVVTCGTVMESLLRRGNAYVRAKAALGEHVAAAAAAGQRAVHLRIHTLYGGGEPSAFMFLGRMLDALRRGLPFAMTAGRQLREYHHVEDEARAIRAVMDAQPAGVLELSQGQPVCLRELAEAVFQAFGRRDFLQVGALPEPPEENYGHIFERPDILAGIAFRDPLAAVPAYLKDCLAGAAQERMDS